MRLAKSSAVYLLTASSLLLTGALAVEGPAATTPSQSSPTKPSREIYDGPAQTPEPALKVRAVVDAPPGAVSTVPTQVSPVMTVWVNDKQVLYTQTFPPTPDPWPSPSAGQIGLGDLQGEIGKTTTIKARSEPTDAPDFTYSRRCRTLECRKKTAPKEDGDDGDNDA
ncbi:uncharacterized protein GIQ15_02611 [Arthroderma uncinatum]|uniref:uncharacterized protein n=1 Tax=Arthroderma uncinatum TaxID=74035 RepID=UPI00144A53A5|nr:uncharacterized protein GIQ15_02611 [Arthroderma uncinatum]KAF3483287.1 hypothetical protein GIQ15_02611 [Arthroderma uncinatum]